MAELIVSPVSTAAEEPVTKPGPKSVKEAMAKKPVSKPTHPTAFEMIRAAIENLKEKKGSSLDAIKKYIETTYKVDIAKVKDSIHRAINKAVERKTLVRTKGKGSNRVFKIVKVAKSKSSEKIKKVAAKEKVKGEVKEKIKKPVSKLTHPTAFDMIRAAIENLKEKKGSSLDAIKKYVETTWKGVEKKSKVANVKAQEKTVKGKKAEAKGVSKPKKIDNKSKKETKTSSKVTKSKENNASKTSVSKKVSPKVSKKVAPKKAGKPVKTATNPEAKKSKVPAKKSEKKLPPKKK